MLAIRVDLDDILVARPGRVFISHLYRAAIAQAEYIGYHPVSVR